MGLGNQIKIFGSLGYRSIPVPAPGGLFKVRNMTNLRKPVKRVSAGMVRESGKPREVIVILRPPNVIGFRAKGCRKEYQLTTDGCYVLAVKAHIAAEKRRKAKEKKKRVRQ